MHTESNQKFANAALTIPQGTMLLQIEPKHPSKKKQEEDLFPQPPIPAPNQTMHRPNYSHLKTTISNKT